MVIQKRLEADWIQSINTYNQSFKMNNEIWKSIPSFPNYEASNLGNIRRVRNNRIVKQGQSDVRGYRVVSIFYNKKKYTKKVARLVWSAFNECECDVTIDHIDRNKTNNNIENLRCVTLKEQFKNRGIYKGRNKYSLTEKDKIEMVKKYTNGEWSTWDISKKYGIPSNYFLTIYQRGSWHKLWTKELTENSERLQSK